jgi:hypothetical protein
VFGDSIGIGQNQSILEHFDMKKMWKRIFLVGLCFFGFGFFSTPVAASFEAEFSALLRAVVDSVKQMSSDISRNQNNQRQSPLPHDAINNINWARIQFYDMQSSLYEYFGLVSAIQNYTPGLQALGLTLSSLKQDAAAELKKFKQAKEQLEKLKEGMRKKLESGDTDNEHHKEVLWILSRGAHFTNIVAQGAAKPIARSYCGYGTQLMLEELATQLVSVERETGMRILRRLHTRESLSIISAEIRPYIPVVNVEEDFRDLRNADMKMVDGFSIVINEVLNRSTGIATDRVILAERVHDRSKYISNLRRENFESLWVERLLSIMNNTQRGEIHTIDSIDPSNPLTLGAPIALELLTN